MIGLVEAACSIELIDVALKNVRETREIIKNFYEKQRAADQLADFEFDVISDGEESLQKLQAPCVAL